MWEMQVNVSNDDNEDWRSISIPQQFSGKAPTYRYANKFDAESMLCKLYPGVDPGKLRVVSV